MQKKSLGNYTNRCPRLQGQHVHAIKKENDSHEHTLRETHDTPTARSRRVGTFAVGVGLGRRRPSAYLRRRSSPSAYTNNRRRIRNRQRSHCGTHKNGSRPSVPRGASWCVWDVQYADGKAVGVFVTIWSILGDVAAPCAPGRCSMPTALPSA